MTTKPKTPAQSKTLDKKTVVMKTPAKPTPKAPTNKAKAVPVKTASPAQMLEAAQKAVTEQQEAAPAQIEGLDAAGYGEVMAEIVKNFDLSQ